MASATTDLRLPFQPKASAFIDWYQIILLGDRGTYVYNLPRVALDSKVARIQTRDLLIASLASTAFSKRPHIFYHNLTSPSWVFNEY